MSVSTGTPICSRTCANAFKPPSRPGPLKLAREDRTVFLSLLGISWLWFIGATFLSSFFRFAKDVLSADPDVVTVLLATFSIGIGIGSLLCERLSKKRIEIGLVPLGSIGLSVFAIDLYFASHALPGAGHLMSVAEFLTMPAHWRRTSAFASSCFRSIRRTGHTVRRYSRFLPGRRKT